MISNNGFLTNRVLRGMRKAMLDSFNRLAFYNRNNMGERLRVSRSPGLINSVRGCLGVCLLLGALPDRVGRALPSGSQ